MRKIPPKYSALELQKIIEQEITIPEKVGQKFIEEELINNSKMQWALNPFLLKGDLLILFENNKPFKLWRFLKSLNWVVLALILCYSMFSQDYKLVLAIPLYLILTPSGVIDLWIFITVLAIFVGGAFYLQINNRYYWLAVSIFIVGYLFSKLTIKATERVLLNKVFADTKTFWSFFSNKLIVSASDSTDAELDRIGQIYPELMD